MATRLPYCTAKEAATELLRLEEEKKRREKKNREVAVKNEVFRTVRLLWNLDFAGAAEALNCTRDEIESAMKAYQSDHTGIELGQNARSTQFVTVRETSFETWEVSQTLVDPEGHNDWVLCVEATHQLGEKPGLKLLSLGPVS